MSAGTPPPLLNERFAIADVVQFESGAGGLTRARITSPAAEAHVYLHGAHVTHFQPAGAEPVLYLSPRSRFEPGVAIRGGVPLVFPWFGARVGHPHAPDHGFARISEWTVESVERRGDDVAIALSLSPSDATRALWPHDFRLHHRVVVGARLSLTLEVENRSHAAFSFEEALHAYFRVGDVERVAVLGLSGARYIDKTDGMAVKTLGHGALHLQGETDRVFPRIESACAIVDPVLGRRLVVAKRGSATTVVWNPWRDKAAAMADLGAGEWRSMLCVETANALGDAVELAPGHRHAMSAVISVAASPAHEG